MPDSLQTFERLFKAWVKAHQLATGIPSDASDLLRTLKQRLPTDTLRLIGSSFINGWLETENSHRAYFVRESDRKGSGSGQTMLSHWGDGKVAPCWETYVQLADYAGLRTVAEPRGLTVRLEDRLMDVTVWAGETLLLYVENKVTAAQATRLLERMRYYGETGFTLDDVDKGNDSLRKAKYLVRDSIRPQYFALSAVGYRQLFQVEYLDVDNKFRLIDYPGPVTAPLYTAFAAGNPPLLTAVDSFAVELHQQLGDRLWLSPGGGQTEFNAYLAGELADAIVLGVYKSGEVWTDLKELGRPLSSRLSIHLRELNIGLEPSKAWAYWMVGSERFNLNSADVVAVADTVANALIPNSQIAPPPS